ncbi:hypothetical protein CASFOL_034781 [Castilleja foliolosa]|uniref:Uncharacterized protein n=1 Tax=Castilleja foliolosa TaxID=1961234 RepID=A0ABD3BRZ5_9LAMI
MEGLIPMVYRSLKKNKKRRTYKCLSSGAAQTFDFCTKDDYDDHQHNYYLISKQQLVMANRVPGSRGPHHRRYNSVDMARLWSFASEDVYKPKQRERFRSRGMLSCITGA